MEGWHTGTPYHGHTTLFVEVVDALLELEHGKGVKEKRRAQHRAMGYMTDEEKLWQVVGAGWGTRARARVECITQREAKTITSSMHQNEGHWGRDLIKVKMLDGYCCPKLDKIIVEAILNFPKCKSFGVTHLHALLDPITRQHPFELIVTDYLSIFITMHTSSTHSRTLPKHSASGDPPPPQLCSIPLRIHLYRVFSL